ncbi:MAG: hypothetical protein ABII71_01450 [Candidatus Micrarchaeota archaeon]
MSGNIPMLEIRGARAEQARPGRIQQIMQRREAFDQAVTALNRWFETNFGPGGDMEDMQAQIRMNPPGGDPLLSNLIDATAALYESMGHPTGIPARGDFAARLAAFNQWMGGRLGAPRAADAPLRAEELRAPAAGQANLYSIAIRDCDDATTVATAVGALAELADQRAAARPATEPQPRPVEPPTVAEVVPRVLPQPQPRPTVAPPIQPPVTATITEPQPRPAVSPPPVVAAPQPTMTIAVDSAEEQARLQSRLAEAISIGTDTLGIISSSTGGPAAFPSDMAQSLTGELTGRLRRARGTLEAHREASTPLTAEYVENVYEGLRRFSETTAMILTLWRYSRDNPPTGDDAEAQAAVVRDNFQMAVSTLTDMNYNPFTNYPPELRATLAADYGVARERITGRVELADALTEVAARAGAPETIRTEATQLAAVLRSGRAPRGQDMTSLGRRGNELLVEADLLRSWEFRYDEAGYLAFRGVIGSAPQLDAAGERAVTAIGAQFGALSRLSYYYADLVRRTYRVDEDRTDLEATSGARRLSLSVERLQETNELLLEAIRIAQASGMAADMVVTRRIGREDVSIPVGQALADCQALSAAATAMLERIHPADEDARPAELSIEDTMAVSELSDRMSNAFSGLLSIGAASRFYNERAHFSSASDEQQQLAFQRLSLAMEYFTASFGEVGDSMIEYPALSTALALGAMETLSPAAMQLAIAHRVNTLAHVSGRVRYAVEITRLQEDLQTARDEEDEAWVAELETALEEVEEARADVIDNYTDYVSRQTAREADFFRLIASLREDADFGVSPAHIRGTRSGSRLADMLLDSRHGRIEIPDMFVRPSALATQIDTNLDQELLPHRRSEGHVVDRAGSVFGEVERQRRIRQDVRMPEVLRTDLSGLGIEGFEQVDIDAFNTALREMAESYGTDATYAQISARGNQLLLQVLDARIGQLEFLLGRTNRPPEAQAQERRYYDIAQSALEDAQRLRVAFGETGDARDMQRNLFDARAFETDPAETIAIAELGLVSLSRVPNFGRDTTEAPSFRDFVYGRARTSILAAHPDQYRIQLPTFVMTGEGTRMTLDAFDTALQRAHQAPVARMFHFLLYRRTTDPNRFLLVNPRHRPGNDQPEILGIADTSAGVVYRAERRTEDEVAGEIWVPERGADRQPVVLFNIREDLAPIFDDAYRALSAGEDRPSFRSGTPTMWIRREEGAAVPTPVAYIERFQSAEE